MVAAVQIMSATLVIQSHRQPLPFTWIQRCLDSVTHWAVHSGYQYRFIGDELFEPLAAEIRAKTVAQPVVATDLARLYWLKSGLEQGFETVIWCDADFLVFEPSSFSLPEEPYALGREVWIQHDDAGRMRDYVKVHNAFLMFRRGNVFLDFYLDSANRLLQTNQGGISPQFIGPKLLTALHNVVQCPVLETAAMLSPPVIRDLLDGGGEALDRLLSKSRLPPAAANLSASLAAREQFSENQMQRLIECLLQSGIPSSGKS